MSGQNTDKIRWLSRYDSLRREIDGLSEIQQQLLADKASVSAVIISDMPHGSMNIDSPQHKLIEKMDAFTTMIIQRRQQLADVQEEIERAIQSVTDPDYRALLRNRYLRCMPWPDVAKAMNKSESNCRGYMHGNALKEINIDTH